MDGAGRQTDPGGESSPRPSTCKSGALPTELVRYVFRLYGPVGRASFDNNEMLGIINKVLHSAPNSRLTWMSVLRFKCLMSLKKSVTVVRVSSREVPVKLCNPLVHGGPLALATQSTDVNSGSNASRSPPSCAPSLSPSSSWSERPCIGTLAVGSSFAKHVGKHVGSVQAAQLVQYE